MAESEPSMTRSRRGPYHRAKYVSGVQEPRSTRYKRRREQESMNKDVEDLLEESDFLNELDPEGDTEVENCRDDYVSSDDDVEEHEACKRSFNVLFPLCNVMIF